MWTLIPALIIGWLYMVAQVLIWRRNKRFRASAPVQVALVSGYSDTKTLVDWDGSLDDEAKVFLDGSFKLAITFQQGLKVGVWSHDGEAAVWIGDRPAWRGSVGGEPVVRSTLSPELRDALMRTTGDRGGIAQMHRMWDPGVVHKSDRGPLSPDDKHKLRELVGSHLAVDRRGKVFSLPTKSGETFYVLVRANGRPAVRSAQKFAQLGGHESAWGKQWQKVVAKDKAEAKQKARELKPVQDEEQRS